MDISDLWEIPPVPGRNDSRDSILLTTSITVHAENGFTTRARIRNISETGMMVDLPARPLPKGGAVEAVVRGIGEVRGVVVWCQDGRAGIRFDAPVNPKAVRRPV